jgi:hypothetical protein
MICVMDHHCVTLVFIQVPRGEVFWDYDSPQIRKNRTRLGLDASPANTPLKVSTPKVKKTVERKCKVTAVPTDTNSLPQGAAEAFQELLQFSKKVQASNQLIKDTDRTVSESSDIGAKISVTDVKFDISTDLTAGISDDESFLIQCSQALDILEKENTCAEKIPVENELQDADVETNFCRSDSFDDIMSQLDGGEQFETKVSVESVAVAQAKPEPSLPLSELRESLANSPVIFKGIKRFKSSDSGIPAKTWSGSGTGYAGSIRRVHSSPTIPAEPVASTKCSAEEIDRKREQAKKKRQLSQMTRNALHNP